MDEIAGKPTAGEIHAVHLQLFKVVMEGDWNGTEDELKEMLLLAPRRAIVCAHHSLGKPCPSGGRSTTWGLSYYLRIVLMLVKENVGKNETGSEV